jgi:hypothetical protein
MENGHYKPKEENKFLIHVQGLLGALPKAEDIQKTYGPHFDLLSAF